MIQYNKTTRKKLRELASEAHERELAKHLEELFEKFHSWKENEIMSSELSFYIHQFHNGPSKELYTFYHHLPEDDLVARAVVLDLLSKEDIPNNILDEIRERIDLYIQRLKNI